MTLPIGLLPFYEFLSKLPSEEGQYVYILKLEEDKYYVGYTTNVARRVVEHVQGHGKGSLWTSRYRPVELVRYMLFRTSEKALEAEKRVTIFLARRGFAVRGGPWTQREPPKSMQEAEARRKYSEQFGEMAKKAHRELYESPMAKICSDVYQSTTDIDSYTYGE